MIRIAIVEDSQVIRESLAEFVQADLEFECVCTCASAEEALEELPKHNPDIVLMDIQLPKLSGIECTAQLKQLLPSAQVIIVTVYEDTERIYQALRAGACGYLLKRCPRQELLAALRDVQQGGAPMSREIARKVIASFQQPVKAAAQLQELTAREGQILELLAQGFANKEIAERIGLSETTVRWHLRHVYNKLHVRSRTAAAFKFRSGQNA